ncbi:UDP-forming cellulose synthase catalytic subunit [Alcaligenaceae bacterium]|nr:UDP-forming cellulose synthase catalytic subunit [Alcaligenaceae bacterium]
MSGLLAMVLTPSAIHTLRGMHGRAVRDRKMGNWTAALFTVLALFANALLRLEGPAWSRLRVRWQPWFAHLTQRGYRYADPLRYLLQGIWLLLTKTGLSAARAPGPTMWQGVRRVAAALRQYVNAALDRLTQAMINSRARKTLGDAHRSPLRSLTRASRRSLFIGVGLLALMLTALLITQPFNLFAQFIFIVLLWGAAMVVRRMPGRFSSLTLIVLSLTVSGRYIWWRYTATLNWNNTLDLSFGLTLLAAETYSWIVLVMGYVQTAWPLRRGLAPLPADRASWPTVDLMIPTYNEDLSVVKPTVYAALGIDWPKDKLRIHLLDDGRRDAFREFAQEVGINYIIRPDGRHAKAGNLNHAMAQTDGELIAIFDCDHIPTRSFLQMTVGWFLKDKKLALVQTPHHFFSADPFERNLGHFGTQPNENALFYGLVQEGNDLWNAAFFCGSCAVLRRTAVESIGGFAVETVTEDAHTALRLHRKGYNSAYVRIPMAAGLATESLSAHVGQRIRWARGMVQIFRTDNPLLGKGLSLFQRLCYMNAMMHFLAGIPRLVYLLAPLAFLLAHSYIIYAPALAIVLYVLPHMVHASLTNSYTQGAYRHSFWGEIYETVLSWYIAWPTTVALLAPGKGKFNVTAKGGLIEKDYFDWSISTPYVLLAFANFLGLGFGFWRLWAGPADEVITVLITMLWVVYNLIVLGAAVAVAEEGKQTRNSHRVAAALPASLQLAGGQVYSGVLSDFSEGGAGLTLSAPQGVKEGDSVRLILARGERQFSFPGKVSRNIGRNMGIAFEPLTQQQHIDLVQCTFARADSWLAWENDFKLDRPMRSMMDIVLLGLHGYRRLADHLPFPLDSLLRGLTGFVSWLASFVPRTRPIVTYKKQVDFAS